MQLSRVRRFWLVPVADCKGGVHSVICPPDLSQRARVTACARAVHSQCLLQVVRVYKKPEGRLAALKVPQAALSVARAKESEHQQRRVAHTAARASQDPMTVMIISIVALAKIWAWR